MVKTPKTRHSRSRREPVTIDLDPTDVSRVSGKDQADNGKQPEEVLGAPAEMPESEEQTEAAASEAAVSNDTASQSRGFDYDFGESHARSEAEATDKTAPEMAKAADEGKANGGFVNDQPVEPKRGSFGALAAGVIGGVVALAGMGVLQTAGLLGSSDTASNSEIAALKSEVAALRSGSNPDASAQLAAALDQVKAEVAALKATPPATGVDEGQMKALSDKVAEFDTALAALRSENGATAIDLGPLNSKVTTLEAQMQSAEQAAATLDGRLGAVEQQTSQLSGKVDAQASQPKIALAIAASALKAALDRGGPFTAELETFAAVRPDAPQIATLRTYAEKGIPTRIDITAGVGDAANAMISAATPVDPDQGVFQRLLTSAESLVKVRPIGAVEGKGAPETVARMEVAVNQGDYAKALSEYDTLPETAKAAGADFAGKLKARQEAEAAVNELVSGAMKG
ncbi:COG4223 family protein [Mesorhizobium sp. 1M-11]|uniref:COG4223 family protein n=1 Tax=Mesorhizobium sp. 1M-11 TaxID=1529006 RepID=UPI0006C76793|nr:COG4223 family protein [Mesorhizobium sp. 1M-11]